MTTTPAKKSDQYKRRDKMRWAFIIAIVVLLAAASGFTVFELLREPVQTFDILEASYSGYQFETVDDGTAAQPAAEPISKEESAAVQPIIDSVPTESDVASKPVVIDDEEEVLYDQGSGKEEIVFSEAPGMLIEETADRWEKEYEPVGLDWTGSTFDNEWQRLRCKGDPYKLLEEMRVFVDGDEKEARRGFRIICDREPIYADLGLVEARKHCGLEAYNMYDYIVNTRGYEGYLGEKMFKEICGRFPNLLDKGEDYAREHCGQALFADVEMMYLSSPIDPYEKYAELCPDDIKGRPGLYGEWD